MNVWARGSKVMVQWHTCIPSAFTESSVSDAHRAQKQMEHRSEGAGSVQIYSFNCLLSFHSWEIVGGQQTQSDFHRSSCPLTFSFNLIQDLLLLLVLWERQWKQIKAVTSPWTNHADLVQWKKTLFGFAWSDDLVAPSSDHSFGPCVCSSRILLRPTVSSSFPSVHLWWTIGVGPSAVFVFGVFSLSEPLLCYRNVPSGQGRK